MHFDDFLRKVAPSLGLHWRPFRRRGVRRKVERRIIQLGLSTFEDYLFKVKNLPEERNYLSKILTVTISRFFRDGRVFHTLASSVIPTLLRKKNEKDLKIWSIGCASGEEPYSLSILWKEKFEKIYPQIRLFILATDINENLLQRAKEGRYKKSSLKEVSAEILKVYFKRDNRFYIVDPAIRECIEFKRHDILHQDPFSGMDIVFCRNLAFTYFSKESQVAVLKKIAIGLEGEGYLLIGKDESLPLIYPTLFVPVFLSEKIYKKFSASPLTY